MPLEPLTGGSVFIDALVATNPAGADDRREGDDHIRGVKNVLKNTFPNINAAVTASDEQINALNGGSAGATFAAGTAAAPSIRFTAATTSGFYSPGADQVGIATAGVARMTFAAGGAVTVNTPSSSTALTVNGLAGPVFAFANATSAQAYASAASATGNGGYFIQTNSVVRASFTYDGAGPFTYIDFSPQLNIRDVTAGFATRLQISAGGNVTVNAPSSGTALSINSVTSGTGLSVTDSSTYTFVARSGGAATTDIGSPLFDAVRIITNALPRIVTTGGGNVTVNAPSSGVHTINGTTVMPSQPLAEIRDSALRTTTGTFTTYGSTTLNLGGMSPNLSAGSITAPVAGTYRITMRGNFSVTGGSPITCGFELRIGGVLVDSFVSIVTATNSVAVQRQTDAVRTLAASDVITIACQITGGTSPNAQVLLFRAELIQ